MAWFANLTHPQALFLGVALVATLCFLAAVILGVVKSNTASQTSRTARQGGLNLKADTSSDTHLQITRETTTDVIGVLASSVDELPDAVTEKLRILILAQYSGSLDTTLSALVTHLFTSDSEDHVLCLKKIVEYAISREGTDIVASIRNYGVVMGKYHGVDIRDVSKDISFDSKMNDPVTLLSTLIALMSVPQFLHLAKKEGVSITNTQEGTKK